MTLAIVIPVYNRKALTLQCLEALSKQTYRDFQVVVVDDGSSDGTPQAIAERFPDVIVHSDQRNLWWAGATNLGIQRILPQKPRWVMALNDDTIPPPDFLENMMKRAFEKPRALLGAFGVDAETGAAAYAGEILNWKTAKFVDNLELHAHEERKGLWVSSHLPGRGMLIPVEVFDRIGFFDAKHFPQTVADLDFTHRARRAGYEIYCNLDAKLLIYPEKSAVHEIRSRKTLKNYYQHLFGLKGGANLKFFFYFALENCPKRDLPLFLLTGAARRVFGYFLH